MASPLVLSIIFSNLYQVVQQKRSRATSQAAEGASSTKFGSISETLFNESLHLLLLALEWKASDLEQHATDDTSDMSIESEPRQVVSVFELKFSASKADLIFNICTSFTIPQPTAESEDKGKERMDLDDANAQKADGEEGEDLGESILRFVVELAEDAGDQFEEQQHALNSIIALVERCDTKGTAKHLLQALRYVQCPSPCSTNHALID